MWKYSPGAVTLAMTRTWTSCSPAVRSRRGAAAGLEVPAGSGVEIEDLGAQQCPGGMRRVTNPGCAVGFLQRDHAAGPGEPGHLGDDILGICDVQQQLRSCTGSEEPAGRPVLVGSGRPAWSRRQGRAELRACRRLPAGAARCRARLRARFPRPHSAAWAGCPAHAGDIDRARAQGYAEAVEQAGGVSAASSSACFSGCSASGWLSPSQ